MRVPASPATWSKGTNGRPQHDGVADVVDAPPAGPPGELGVLARGEELVALAGELGQLLDHDRTSRHVDPEREGLGGEDDLDQTGREAGLHRLLERRDQAGVVGGDSRPPGRSASRRSPSTRRSSSRQGVDVRLGDGPDLAALLGGGEAPSLAHALGHGVVAGGPAEDEVDRRQHVLLAEQLDAPRPGGV